MTRVMLAGAILVLAVLNLAHPWLHAFEGGGLDVMLVYLNGYVVQFGSNGPLPLLAHRVR